MSEGCRSTAGCIVYERGGFWGARLRQAPGLDKISIRRCGSLADCWPNLELLPSSVVLLEADEARLEGVFELLCRIGSRFPHARSLVMLPRGMHPHQQWWLREAGAMHVVRSSRELQSVARLVRRHVQQAPTIAMTWAQQIEAKLPWSSPRVPLGRAIRLYSD